eukprot:10085746-Heterocapsa_arctica.AAC.1
MLQYASQESKHKGSVLQLQPPVPTSEEPTPTTLEEPSPVMPEEPSATTSEELTPATPEEPTSTTPEEPTPATPEEFCSSSRERPARHLSSGPRVRPLRDGPAEFCTLQNLLPPAANRH